MWQFPSTWKRCMRAEMNVGYLWDCIMSRRVFLCRLFAQTLEKILAFFLRRGEKVDRVGNITLCTGWTGNIETFLSYSSRLIGKSQRYISCKIFRGFFSLLSSIHFNENLYNHIQPVHCSSVFSLKIA